MKTYTLDEVQDELLGKVGTPERDRFEYELQLEYNEREGGRELFSRPPSLFWVDYKQTMFT
jgi:hypothetical protein